MSEEETTDAEETAAEAVETVAGEEPFYEDGDMDTTGTVIQDTDIVFDCPHCGHNLAIDYRGAGLQINCVNCGESVLVLIPDGMEIEDLDIEPGEILKQLFATRRNLHKAELRADDLEARLAEAMARNERVVARFAALQMQLDEMRQLCLQQDTVNAKLAALVERLGSAVPDDDDTAKEAASPEE